jgi:hypothetical protein
MQPCWVRKMCKRCYNLVYKVYDGKLREEAEYVKKSVEGECRCNCKRQKSLFEQCKKCGHMFGDIV